MTSSDSEQSSSSNRNRSRSRSRSRSRNQSRSPSVDMSTMTDPSMFRRRRSPRKSSLKLKRHLLENYDKYKNKIPINTSVMWIGSDNPREKFRNLPRIPLCTGARQLCRSRDPVTKRYVQIPDDGSEDDIYDITIFHEKPKKTKKKKKKKKTRSNKSK